MADNPDEDKFVAGAAAPVKWTRVACTTCRHLDPNHRMRCAAFPDGIPWEIRGGDNDHRAPFPGDHGIQYEPVKGGA